jgi:uncharacterized membrane protein
VESFDSQSEQVERLRCYSGRKFVLGGVYMARLSELFGQHFDVFFLLVIPAVVPVLMCFVKRKPLWISPIISFILGLLLTYIAFPNIFTLLITGRDFLGGSWLMVVPIHVMASIIMTAICHGVCYVINFIKTRKRKP